MTEQTRLLAIDLGAGSGRALVGTLEHGRLRVRELARFANEPLTVRGHYHWNVPVLFERIKDALGRDAREYGSPPESLGVDTWGVDFGLLDAGGRLLDLPHTYRDPRTRGAMESFFRKVPRERVYERTGIQFLPFNTLFQLESMVRDGSPLLENASDLLFIPDLFHYMLAGVKRTEFTFATTSQLYNPIQRGWDDELFGALGLPVSMMQEVVMPGAVLGAVSEEISRETGFACAAVVAVATHDTGSAVAAVPAEGRDWAYISSGTWSLMGVESEEPILGEEALRLNFTNEGGVGGTFRVLKNIAGLWLLEQCRKAWSSREESTYDELIEAAEAAPPFAALVDPDHPDFLDPPDMPSALRAYCERTGQSPPESIGATVRCILESLALKYRFVLEQLKRIAPHPIGRIHIIGGGVQNRLLCRFAAEATGLPVLAGPVEATAIGNLLVQAMAVHRVSSLEEIRQMVRNSFPVERFDPEAPEAWEPAWRRFVDLDPI